MRKVEMAVLGSLPLISLMADKSSDSAFKMRESLGGRPGLPVPNKPDGFCGRKATLKLEKTRKGHRQSDKSSDSALKM